MTKYRRIETPIFVIPNRKKHSLVMTGPELKTMREIWHMSQSELGKALGGYTQRAVSAWESEQNTIPPAVNKLMMIFVYHPKLIRQVCRN